MLPLSNIHKFYKLEADAGGIRRFSPLQLFVSRFYLIYCDYEFLIILLEHYNASVYMLVQLHLP